MPVDRRLSVVVLTHNRADELERTLARLSALPEQPPIVVVDNGSVDATAVRVGQRFPGVRLVRAPSNLGAAGRNLGVAEVTTPYVAFCDDDTWWEPGALARAADLLDAHPRLGVISGSVLVGEENALDPACARMADSPLPARGLPGPELIAFMAGAAVMRTAAFRAAGGYEARFFLGAEEQLLALDLAVLGWDMVYAEDVVTHHHPSASRDPARRRAVSFRNRLWLAWMRLPWAAALRETRGVLREARAHGLAGESLGAALAGLVWALRRRRCLPASVWEKHRQVFGRAPPEPRMPAWLGKVWRAAPRAVPERPGTERS